MNAGFFNQESMARSLVTYISDPARVQKIVAEHFGAQGRPISLAHVKRMRAKYERQAAEMKHGKGGKNSEDNSPYLGVDGRAGIAEAAAELLAAIAREHPERVTR